MDSRHRPGTAPGPAGDRPSPFAPPAGDPTPITQVKVHTRAKPITGFSLSKPVPSFKTGYRFSGSRLTSLTTTGSFLVHLYAKVVDIHYSEHLCFHPQ